MELSRFVRIIPKTDSTILFNTINSCIVECEHIWIPNQDVFLRQFSESELTYLNANQFFIDDGSALKLFYSPTEENVINITISLTEQCNLHCRYCYENDLTTRLVMKTDTVQKIIQYIEKVLESDQKIEMVCFDLIGGEPLLALDSISYLIEGMQQICGVGVHYQIETNGTLFTDQVRDILKDVETTINIALTPPEDHNFMRPFKNGTSTYSTILNNLIDSKDFFASSNHNLVIRYNANKNNSDRIDDFSEYLRDTLSYEFSLEIAPIINYSYNSMCNTLSPAEYSTWFLDKYFALTNDVFCPEKFLLLSRRNKGCTALKEHNIKIHPDGTLALCNAWVVGNRAGNINMLLSGITKENIFSPNFLSGNLDAECRMCKDLFLCGGKRFCRKEDQCHFVDFDIDEYIKMYTKGQSNSSEIV